MASRRVSIYSVSYTHLSRFFLSLEDDLMRIFGGERVQSLMDTLDLDEDMPIENKQITNTIESAQK